MAWGCASAAAVCAVAVLEVEGVGLVGADAPFPIIRLASNGSYSADGAHLDAVYLDAARAHCRCYESEIDRPRENSTVS